MDAHVIDAALDAFPSTSEVVADLRRSETSLVSLPRRRRGEGDGGRRRSGAVYLPFTVQKDIEGRSQRVVRAKCGIECERDSSDGDHCRTTPSEALRDTSTDPRPHLWPTFWTRDSSSTTTRRPARRDSKTARSTGRDARRVGNPSPESCFIDANSIVSKPTATQAPSGRCGLGVRWTGAPAGERGGPCTRGRYQDSYVK